MELIDRKKLNKKKKYQFKTEYGAFPKSNWFFRCEDVMQAEVVDAVTVVRCEDCVCYRKVGNLHPYCTLLLREMPANGYCNYGLRKDLEHGTN